MALLYTNSYSPDSQIPLLRVPLKSARSFPWTRWDLASLGLSAGGTLWLPQPPPYPNPNFSFPWLGADTNPPLLDKWSTVGEQPLLFPGSWGQGSESRSLTSIPKKSTYCGAQLCFEFSLPLLSPESQKLSSLHSSGTCTLLFCLLLPILDHILYFKRRYSGKKAED